jgi:hypothetical protein
MKTIQLIIIGLSLSSRLFSQDTLYTTEGHIIAGKVMEISNDDIKYKKASNLDGPVYVISKADVVLIEYKNGVKDVFAKTDNTTGTNNSSQANVNNNNSSYPQQVYVTPRPAVNVVLGALPFYGYNPWGWNRNWGYRAYVGYRGGYGGYHGGYHGGGYHGGGHGHHR